MASGSRRRTVPTRWRCSKQQARTRVPELVPIRYGRMLVSPFTFFRGGASIMAADLAGTPRRKRDEWRADLGCMLRTTDVRRGGLLRVSFGAVDVVHAAACRTSHMAEARRRLDDVPVAPGQRDDVGRRMPRRAPGRAARARPLRRCVACREHRRCPAPKMADALVVPGNAVLVGIGRVVLLGDEVAKSASVSAS